MHNAVLCLSRLRAAAVDVLLQSWHGNLCRGKSVQLWWKVIERRGGKVGGGGEKKVNEKVEDICT